MGMQTNFFPKEGVVARNKIKNKPHRSKYEIVNMILQVVLLRNQSPSSSYMCKTLHIGYDVGIAYKMTLDYLAALVESGFLLMKKTKSSPYLHYEITENGRRYLQIYSEIQDSLLPYFEEEDNLLLEEVDTEANAWL